MKTILLSALAALPLLFVSCVGPLPPPPPPLPAGAWHDAYAYPDRPVYVYRDTSFGYDPIYTTNVTLVGGVPYHRYNHRVLRVLPRNDFDVYRNRVVVDGHTGHYHGPGPYRRHW